MRTNIATEVQRMWVTTQDFLNCLLVDTNNNTTRMGDSGVNTKMFVW